MWASAPPDVFSQVKKILETEVKKNTHTGMFEDAADTFTLHSLSCRIFRNDDLLRKLIVVGFATLGEKSAS